MGWGISSRHRLRSYPPAQHIQCRLGGYPPSVISIGRPHDLVFPTLTVDSGHPAGKAHLGHADPTDTSDSTSPAFSTWCHSRMVAEIGPQSCHPRLLPKGLCNVQSETVKRPSRKERDRRAI